MSAESGDPHGTVVPPLPTLRDGRYRVLGTLGVGSQAQTLEAEDAASGMAVAIKRFVVRGKQSWKEVELAEREAAVLSQLQHPNLPRYLDHFEEQGVLYLVMEKIEGKTLAELRRTSALSRSEMLRFLEDAARILAYLHERSPPIIHRDIKPENVIRRPDGSFALVDFGSVRDRLRPEGGSTVVGTFGYMAPEQFQGRALPTTDVYGVGATAIACLTGQDPDKLPHRGLAIDVPRALGAHADPRWVELLSNLLDPDPDRRAQTLRPALELLRRNPKEGRESRSQENPADVRWAERTPERERRDARRRRKQERKQERKRRRSRAGWHAPRHAHWSRSRGVESLLWLLVPALFWIARLAVFGLFRFLLPILLGVLALIFGARFRRAARVCAEIGRAGEVALRRARARLLARDRETDAGASTEWQTRYRVTNEPAEASYADEEYEEPLGEESPSARRRR